MLIGRYTTVPVDLYRIQSAASVRLREKAKAVAAGRASFDLSLHEDGLVHPVDPAEPRFMGPNGMSMRPANDILAAFISGFRGKMTLYKVPAGTPLPPELVLLHEHTSHYSMQCAKPMKLSVLNTALTKFLTTPPVVCVIGRDEVYKTFPYLTPAANGFSENGQ